MSLCTHTHSYWAGIIRTCPLCGQSYDKPTAKHAEGAMSDDLKERLRLADDIERHEMSRYWCAGDWILIVSSLREAARISDLEAERDTMIERMNRALAKADYEAERAGDMENEKEAMEARSAKLIEALQDLLQKAGAVATWLNHWDVPFAGEEEWAGASGDCKLFFNALNNAAALTAIQPEPKS